jgi:hypothetical protein
MKIKSIIKGKSAKLQHTRRAKIAPLIGAVGLALTSSDDRLFQLMRRRFKQGLEVPAATRSVRRPLTRTQRTATLLGLSRYRLPSPTRIFHGAMAVIMLLSISSSLIMLMPRQRALAVTVGPFFAGTGANFNDGGTTAWTDPGNATGDTTGTAATVSPPSNGSTSQRLRLSNFGFSIPSGATIDGVTVEVEQQAGNANRHRWNSVRLLIGGSESGSDLSDASAIPTAKGFKTFGSASNLWGLTPSSTDINGTDFGVSLKIDRNAAQATTTSIFRVRITVDYTLNTALEQSGYRWFENQDIQQQTFAQTWGGTGTDIAYALALDASGNIYVAGDTGSTGLTAGSIDQTLVKYDSSGIEQWSKTWGGTGADYARALALDASGNIYVAGDTASSDRTAGLSDQTLVKYNSSGVEQWSKTWGGDSTDIAYALALDSSGNIYVAGYTASTGRTAGGTDHTLVKYDSSGVEQWSKTWGGTGFDAAYALALDASGNIYVAGDTASSDRSAGSSDQTLVKYDSSGVEQWSKTWGGTGNERAYALTLDTSGNIYVVGYTDSSDRTAGGV